jgi:muconate/chloromuconate cycloisomerase
VTDLRIVAIDTTIVELPISRPHRFANHQIDHQAYLIVRLETDAGTVGVGEGVSPGGPWWSGESIEGQRQIIDHYFTPALLGADCLNLNGVMSTMDRMAYGNEFAKAAVEMAVIDAASRACGIAAYTLVGGTISRERLPVRWALSGAGEDEVVQDAVDRIALGHRGLKVKMGALPPREDIRRLGVLIDKIGSDVDYFVDPNCRWDLRTAVWATNEIEAMGVAAVEQPLDRADIDGMATLVEKVTRLIIIADESVCRPRDALVATGRRACDAVSVKPAKAGGLRRAGQVASITSTAGLSCYGGTALETSIGTAAAAHLFATFDELQLGCELIGPLLLVDDLTVAPITYSDGYLHVPDGPGFGVEVDWDKVSRYSRKSE